MSGAVSIIEDAPDAVLATLAACRPTSPFLGPSYASARRALGERVIAFVEGDPSAPRSAAVGFLRGSAWRSTLEITSADAPHDPKAFWQDVRAWSRRKRVGLVVVGTFASERATLPEWPDPHRSSARCEWLLDLTTRPTAPSSSNHRRSLGRARKAGLVFERHVGREGLDAHLALMNASLERRESRGESVELADAGLLRELGALFDAGVAELVRTSRGSEVLSSLLLLHAADATYYQSAGTSPVGMELGASVFNVQSAIEAIAAEGRRWFNLAGAGDENPGLQRFKAGFGAERRDLASAVYDLRPVAVRKALTAARLARDPRALGRALVRVDSMVVHAIDPTRRESAVVPGTLRRLDDEALQDLARRVPELASHWARRQRMGFNAAFAYEEEGEVRHVAWLVEPHDDAGQPERNVALRSGEAEITHCETPTAARGKGAYPRAIALLLEEAARRGVRRAYMITNVTNTASRRGIEKAGLPRVGTIGIVSVLGGRFTLRIRSHRWPRLLRP